MDKEKIIPAKQYEEEDVILEFSEKSNVKWKGILGTIGIITFFVIILGLVYFLVMKPNSDKKNNVKKDTTVTDTTATPDAHSNQKKQKIKVVSVFGMEKEDAKVVLKELGLKVKVKYNYDTKIEKGKVCKQSIAKGKTVENGTKIVIVVSKGKKVNKRKEKTVKENFDLKSKTTTNEESKTETNVTKHPTETKAPVKTKKPSVKKEKKQEKEDDDFFVIEE